MTDKLDTAYVLERVRYGCAMQVSYELLEDIQIKVVDDLIGPRIVGMLSLWARELERQEVTYPADWWQALKDRWAPAWAKRRWPVRMNSHVLCAMAFYPSFKYDIPGHQAHIGIMTRRDDHE